MYIDFILKNGIIISGRIEEGGYFSTILSGRVRLPPKKAHGAHYRFRFYRLTSRDALQQSDTSQAKREVAGSSPARGYGCGSSVG